MNPYAQYAAAAATTIRKIDAPGTSRKTKPASSAKNTGSMSIPQSTPEAIISEAYAAAALGRRQASLAVSRLESLIFRHPGQVAPLKAAAMKWLAGVDLNDPAASQATVQAIIKRLNECLDGASRRVTTAILEADDIAQLRLFRQQVRDLIRGH